MHVRFQTGWKVILCENFDDMIWVIVFYCMEVCGILAEMTIGHVSFRCYDCSVRLDRPIVLIQFFVNAIPQRTKSDFFLILEIFEVLLVEEVKAIFACFIRCESSHNHRIFTDQTLDK